MTPILILWHNYNTINKTSPLYLQQKEDSL